MKRHDPEANAAAYLGGAMSRRARRRFEGHVLECPDCWEEVRLGGVGRAYAEAGRELAPQPLRDRIRAEVSLAPVRRRIRPGAALAAVAVAAAIAGGTLTLLSPGPPRPIELLVADFRGDRVLDETVAPELPPELGRLALVEVAAGPVDRLSVVGHRYRDAAGHRVTVYRADRPFPTPDGARAGDGDTWRAEVDGVTLLCSDRPFPALIVGEDDRDVVAVARTLGLV